MRACKPMLWRGALYASSVMVPFTRVRQVANYARYSGGVTRVVVAMPYLCAFANTRLPTPDLKGFASC